MPVAYTEGGFGVLTPLQYPHKNFAFYRHFRGHGPLTNAEESVRIPEPNPEIRAPKDFQWVKF